MKSCMVKADNCVTYHGREYYGGEILAGDDAAIDRLLAMDPPPVEACAMQDGFAETQSELPEVPATPAENKPEPDEEPAFPDTGSGAPISGKRFGRRPRM